jgi:hypothetical protein
MKSNTQINDCWPLSSVMSVLSVKFVHNLNKEKVSWLILFAKLLGLLTYFELNKILSSRDFLYFGLHITKFSSEISRE